MLTCRKCNEKFPTSVKIDGKRYGLYRRKFCLRCSPFKEHNTRKLDTVSENGRVCPRCNKNVPLSQFYQRRNKPGSSSYCKSCTNHQTIERQQKFKQICVDYKGGKCQKCGYDKYIGSLEFHHQDSNDKLFEISKARHKQFSDKVKEELDKCELLCSNCHKETHWQTTRKYPQ